jgi:hypothetical protein
VAASLFHPHIVGVHDRGELEGQLWIAMDRARYPLRQITLAGTTNKEGPDSDAVANGHRVMGEDLRRFADSIRDLDDPEVMAHAWDRPDAVKYRSATSR